MYNELTNLLPPERQHSLVREYFFRISTVVAFIVTTLTLVAAILLLPIYVFINGSINSKKSHLTNIELALSSADEKALSTRLATLSSDAESLVALSDIKSVGAVTRNILAIPHPGVALLNFSYAPFVNTSSRVMTVSGLSDTRTTLRNYQLALQASPLILSAVLPVSAYAKDTDIAFTITVTLAP